MITYINVKNLRKYISWSFWGVYICFVIFYIVYAYTIFLLIAHDHDYLEQRPLSHAIANKLFLFKCCLFICQIFLYCLWSFNKYTRVTDGERENVSHLITDANSSESLLEEMRDWYDDFIAISTYSFTVALDLSSFNI